MTDVIDSWTWHGHEGEKTRAEIFTNTPYVKLMQNGQVIGIKKVKRYRASFEVEYKPGTLKAVSLDSQKRELSAAELKTYGKTELLKTVVAGNHMRTNGQDLCFAEIMLTDINGNTVSYDDRHIQIEMPVDTEITLEGFGSAAPVTDEGFVSSEHSSWRGRALAVFRAGYRNEKIRVCIRAEGIKKPAYLDIICSRGERK